MLALAAKTLIRLPVIIDAHCLQLQDGLGTRFRPAYTRLFHAVLDQMTTRSFNDTAADRPASIQVLIIAHVGQALT